MLDRDPHSVALDDADVSATAKRCGLLLVVARLLR
jgi:hypothetical protein